MPATSAGVKKDTVSQGSSTMKGAFGGPPPYNSGITGIQEDPNIITAIPGCHYYSLGGSEQPLLNRPNTEACGLWMVVPLIEFRLQGSGCRI